MSSMEFKKIQTVAFFGLLIGAGILFYQVIQPYIFAIFWAAVIASLFYPVYTRLQKRIKNNNIAAATTVLIVILVVLLPLVGVFSLVVKQAFDTYAHITKPETFSTIQETIERITSQPKIQELLGGVDIREKLRDASSTIASFGIQLIKVGSQNTIVAVINALIMLYSLYYFLKDGEKWLRHLMHLLPFGDSNEEVLYEKFASTGKATLKGTILLGMIQGTIGGIFFAIVGIPSAVFWGLVMVVFAIIPAAGAGVVMVPGALYLFITGHIWQGIVLTIAVVFVGLIDNLLRPLLVGKDMQMHPVVILLSTIGGLSLFGISGVVAGPMIAALFLAVIGMYEVKYKKELDSSRT